MRAMLLASALLLPMAAQAQSPFVGLEIPVNVRQNQNQGQHQGQAQQQRQRQGQSQSQTGSSASSGGGNVTFQDRLQAPGLASYAAPSGPCVGVSTFGTASFAGVGGGFGRSEIEDECQVREAARLLHAMGETREALALIRNLPSVRRGMPQPQPAAQPVAAIVAEPLPPVAAAPAPQRPGWCDTASGPERERVAYVRECRR